MHPDPLLDDEVRQIDDDRLAKDSEQADPAAARDGSKRLIERSLRAAHLEDNLDAIAVGGGNDPLHGRRVRGIKPHVGAHATRHGEAVLLGVGGNHQRGTGRPGDPNGT